MVFRRVLGLVPALAIAASRLGAQAWDTPRVLTLVQRATDRRVQQLADSGLVGYQATAHGYLTFLAQLGEGFREIPRVVKADELALEVYWRAPNLSKQRIVGRRDTTLLPTDIEYHRDHLGIIQNDFPAIIRVGEGDEVRDVPHPLSESGLKAYQFALTDSLRITSPGRVIDVYEVQVRPRDARLPGVVGAVYLDRDNARVVRMAFNFTRASFLDTQLEDVSIVLENGLVGSRFWLPRRQEVEIRRTLTWLDYPVRGIIRGRWDIRDYTINTDLAVVPFFAGPEITFGPPAQLKSYAWTTPQLVDSLPAESRIPTPIEIRRVQDAARVLIRAQGMKRARATLAARSASDFVRFDRIGGLALGTGVSARVGLGLVADARGRFGFGDHSWLGGLSFGWQSANGVGLRVFASDDVRSAGDMAERSTLMNSIAAQEFGADFTDNYGVRAVGLAGMIPVRSARLTAELSHESQRPLRVSAIPFERAFRPAFDADAKNGGAIALQLDLPTREVWRGIELGLRANHRGSEPFSCIQPPGTACSYTRVARSTLTLNVERQFGSARLVHRTFAGTVEGTEFLLSQDLFFMGGPVSAPGRDYHSLVGDRVLSQEIEARLPVPFPSLSLGRFGRSAARAQIAPHWTAVRIHQVDASVPILRGSGPALTPDPFRPTATGWYQSAGVSLITMFDLLRLDVSRALPTGKWLFSIDVTRPFWSIM